MSKKSKIRELREHVKVLERELRGLRPTAPPPPPEWVEVRPASAEAAVGRIEDHTGIRVAIHRMDRADAKPMWKVTFGLMHGRKNSIRIDPSVEGIDLQELLQRAEKRVKMDHFHG